MNEQVSIQTRTGWHAYLETIVLENPQLADQWHANAHVDSHAISLHPRESIVIPTGHRFDGVPQEIYDGYRAGLESACADVVIATHLEDGQPAVLGLLRQPGRCYAKTWYIPGGAIHAYMSITEFLATKIYKETGLDIAPQALIGIYRNNAEDFICSATAICYAALVPVQTIRATKAADGHTDWRLFTASDLSQLPPSETHWYPMHVWRRALACMPPAR